MLTPCTAPCARVRSLALVQAEVRAGSATVQGWHDAERGEKHPCLRMGGRGGAGRGGGPARPRGASLSRCPASVSTRTWPGHPATLDAACRSPLPCQASARRCACDPGGCSTTSASPSWRLRSARSRISRPTPTAAARAAGGAARRRRRRGASFRRRSGRAERRRRPFAPKPLAVCHLRWRI